MYNYTAATATTTTNYYYDYIIIMIINNHNCLTLSKDLLRLCFMLKSCSAWTRWGRAAAAKGFKFQSARQLVLIWQYFKTKVVFSHQEVADL